MKSFKLSWDAVLKFIPLKLFPVRFHLFILNVLVINRAGFCLVYVATYLREIDSKLLFLEGMLKQTVQFCMSPSVYKWSPSLHISVVIMHTKSRFQFFFLSFPLLTFPFLAFPSLSSVLGREQFLVELRSTFSSMKMWILFDLRLDYWKAWRWWALAIPVYG